MPLTRLHNILLLSAAACLLLFGFAQAAAAEEKTDRCHCFNNRSYDPAEKFAADDYLLTTTTNSLLAARFDISKRLIVMMKMKGGVANTDLLIGLHLAAARNTDVGHILVLKGDENWQTALRGKPELSRLSESDALAREMRDGLPPDRAARRIMTGILGQQFGTAPKTVKHLAEQSLTPKEIVLVLTLADHTGTRPDLIVSFHENGLSWSEIAHNFGLTPAGVGKLLLPESND